MAPTEKETPPQLKQNVMRMLDRLGRPAALLEAAHNDAAEALKVPSEFSKKFRSQRK